MIEAALRETGGQVSGSSGAAAKLGIHRSTLESKIQSLKIDKYRFKSAGTLERRIAAPLVRIHRPQHFAGIFGNCRKSDTPVITKYFVTNNLRLVV